MHGSISPPNLIVRSTHPSELAPTKLHRLKSDGDSVLNRQ